MKLDKYYDEINKTVLQFVKSIDEEYTCHMGTDFSVDLDNNDIEWSLLYVEESGRAFYEKWKKVCPLALCFSYFTVALLHEIGHLETEWDMVDDTEKRNSELTGKEYFNLYNEKIATAWASDFCIEHFERAIDFDTQINFLLKNFYYEVGLIEKGEQ